MTEGRARLLASALAAALGGACGPEEVPAAELGGRLFRDPRLSTSPFNVFSCGTCHAVEPRAPPVVPGRFDPGYNLAGVTERGRWWGGGEIRLLDAINVCLAYFMAGRRLAPDEDRARQLYAYLESTAGEAGVAREAAPFTIVRVVTSLPDLVGDARRGADIYGRACRRCHAPAHAVAGRLTPLAGQVPEDTVKSFPKNARHAVVEKIRHGRFFNIGGLMPLYAREVLSDEEVADVLAHLGL